jgi:hypothetical protein
MNDFEQQWRSLSVAGHSGGRLRVYPDHLLDFFIDYSLSGNREMVIEARGTDLEFNDLPIFENLDLIVKPIPTGICIGLSLTDNELVKSFSVMCYDIAERSKTGETVEAAVVIAIECLRGWASLLKRRGKTGLTRNEAMGLWGELSVLEELIRAQPGNQSLIIQGWRGPNGDQRDVGFNSHRVEIKTQLSTKGVGLRITSLDQLDERGENLKVVLNRVSPSDKGLSLAGLIDRTEALLAASRSAQSEFERKIELAGFEPEQETCKELFALDERFIYEVREGFPRLTPDNVPAGIRSAEYEITGTAISSFQIAWDKLVENLSEQPR